MTYGDEDLFKQYGYTDDSEQTTPVTKQSNSNTNTQTNVDDLFAQYGYDENKHSEPQAKNVQTTQSKTFSEPTIQNNEPSSTLVLEGSVKKTTPYQWFRNNIRPAHFLGDLGKSTANAFREESIMGANAITGAKNWALDKVGLSKWHRPTEEVKAEREALIPKFDTNENAHVANFVGDMLGWAPMFAVGGEGIAAIKGGAKAAKVASVASKTGRTAGQTAKVLARREAINAASKKAAEDAFLKDASVMQQIIRPQTFANAAKTAHNAGMDMATFEGLRHGLRTLGGEEQENTFGQDVLQCYGMGAAFGGGASALGSVAKPVAKAIGETKLAKDISGKVGEVINSNDKISHAVANFQNALNVGRNSKDVNVNKYRDFEKLLQESGLPEEEINANLLEYSNLSARDKIRVDKAVRKQLMELERPSTERPQFFGEEPTIQTNKPTLDDLINPSGRNSFAEPQPQMQPIERLNRIEEALDNGTPITRKAIYEATPEEYNYLANQLKQGNNWDDAQAAEFLKENGVGLKEEPIVNQGFESTPYEFNPADDINLFEQARDYNVPQNNIEYAQTPVEPKQPALDLPKVKPNTKKTLADWKSKYSKKNTSVEEGRPVESSEGINTHEKVETPQNEPSYQSQNEHSVSRDRLIELRNEIESQLDRPYKDFVNEYGESSAEEYEKLLQAKNRIDNELAKSTPIKKYKGGENEGGSYDENWQPVNHRNIENTPNRVTYTEEVMDNGKRIRTYNDGKVEYYNPDGTLHFRAKVKRKIAPTSTEKDFANYNTNNLKKVTDPVDITINKLEAGEAEGSNTSYKTLKAKTETKVSKEHDYKPDEYELGSEAKKGEALDNGLTEEVPNSGRFASEDAEFNSWYDKYEKADADTRAKMLEEKINSFSKREEGLDFYDKFSEQIDRDKDVFDRDKPSGFKALSKEYKPSVSEEDLLDFTSKFESADTLPTIAKETRIHNEELANKMQEMSGKQELEILGFGRNKDINTRIAKDIAKVNKKGYRTRSGNKTLEFLAFGKLNKHNTRIGLDQMYRQIKNRIEKYKNEGFATTRLEEALDKAYARKLKELGVPMKEAKGIPQHIESEGAYNAYKQNLKDKYGIKEYAYKDKTTLGIDSLNNKEPNAKLYGDKIKNKEFKADENQLKDGEAIQQWRERLNNNSLDDFELSNVNNVGTDTIDRYISVNPKGFEGRKFATLRDMAKRNPELSNVIKGYENTPIHFAHKGVKESTRGYYKDGKIYINPNNKNIASTIKHELRHLKDEEYIKTLPRNSRARKLWESGKVRNNEKRRYYKKYKNDVDEVKGLLQQYRVNDIDAIKDVLSTRQYNIAKEYNRLVNRYKSARMEIRARQAAQDVQLGNIRSNGKYGLDSKRSFQRGRRFDIGDVFKRRGKNLFSDEAGESGLLGSNEMESGTQPISRTGGIRGTVGNSRGRSKEQPIGLKSFREPNLEATKYQKYDKSTGLSPKEWLNEVKETKKNYGLTDSKAKALVKRAANEIKTTSDETEKLLIKRGIITEEQAANRKKMVGSSTYIADRPEYTADGKIDLTRTYEDLKEGVTGKREHRTVKNIHLENAYRNTQSYNAQAKYMNSVMDYIEKEFAKPIENGRVLSGYKAVNSKLLSNAVFGRYSKEWYETIYDGPEAIRKAFKDEKVAKAWEDLHKRTNTPDIQIPEEVYNSIFNGKGESAADYISRYGSKHPLKSFGKLTSAVHDAMMERFKQRVLTSASFVMNNRIGNQIMIAAHSDNPVEYIKSLYDATKLKNSDLPAGILESNINNEIKSFNIRKKYTGYAPLDNAFNLFGGQLLDTSTLKGMSKVSATTLNWFVGKPARAFAKWSDKVMRFNQKFEDFERKQVYAKHINKERRKLVKRTGQKMITQQEFVDQINKDSPLRESIIEDIQNTLGDYNNFSKFEKDYLKRVVPFYSWYRTISRHTYQLAKKNPERAALIMYELDDIKNNKQQDLKEYQRGSIKTGVKNKLTGDNLVINKMHAMPYMTFREDLGVNPFIQVPAEAIRGKKFFQNQEISNKRYARFYEGKDEKYYDTKTGKTLDKLPASTRIGYVGKQLLWNNAFPYFDNPMLDVNKTSGLFFNKFSKDASKKDKGQWHMYDKSYDATVFGGFNIGDKVGTAKYKGKYDQDKEKEIIRSGKSRYRNRTALLNRGLGLSIQNENPSDYFSKKEEKESLSHKLSVARRVKAWRAKHKKK